MNRGTGDLAAPYANSDANGAMDGEPQSTIAYSCKNYRMSEIGQIPAEWALVSLAELSMWITKGSTPATYGFRWQVNGVLFLRSECVSPHGLDFSESTYISEAAHKFLARSRVFDGDLLITITGNVGRVARLKRVGEANINQHIARVRLSSGRVSADYVAQYLGQERVRRRFESITTGQAYPQISLKQVQEALVPLPPIKEQKAISEVLSDADELIESLDRLIAKKRAIKQATMQQLLTGETRLPGFAADTWVSKPFSDVLQRLNSDECQIRTSDYRSTGRFPVVDQSKARIVGFTDRTDKVFACPEGGVIVFGDHTCIVKFVNFDFSVGAEGTQVLSAKGGMSTRFIALQLEFSGVEPTGYNRHFKLLKEEWFCVPSPEEQRAIAQLFDDFESEIEALERRREKARQIKEGMMQELLTGRTRLVESGSATPESATV